MKPLFLFILLLFILSFWSCQKEIDNPEPLVLENEYFPIIIGNWISYQIEEINIDKESAVNDTVKYQIKEVIESLIENLDDYKTYRLERYYRKNETQEWEILNVWQIRQYPRHIHKIEENIEYVRLTTPIKLNEKWDGNAFNENETQNYKLSNISDTLINNSQNRFISVIQQNESSLIDKLFSEEKYLKDIGLIQKTDINVELNIDPNLPWNEKVIKGTIFYQNYIESSL